MKKNGIMNAQIASIVASMGHTDTIAIVDAGFPIPESVCRIDTAIKPGLPSFLEVLQNVLQELAVEEIIVAQELISRNPALCEQIQSLCPGARLRAIPHELFKEESHRCKAVVRTGDCVSYSNVILRSGVIF